MTVSWMHLQNECSCQHNTGKNICLAIELVRPQNIMFKCILVVRLFGHATFHTKIAPWCFCNESKHQFQCHSPNKNFRQKMFTFHTIQIRQAASPTHSRGMFPSKAISLECMRRGFASWWGSQVRRLFQKWERRRSCRCAYSEIPPPVKWSPTWTRVGGGRGAPRDTRPRPEWHRRRRSRARREAEPQTRPRWPASK